MAIEDDIALFSRVPTLNLLGTAALQVLAIGSEQIDYEFGEKLFHTGDKGDAGFIVKMGSFRILDDSGVETVAGPNALIGELALIVARPRPATATALERSSVLRVSRSLFQRVLESHPDAARRLRDDLASRTTAVTGAISKLTARLR